MKIGIVVPHIFMHRDILPNVIFSPGQLVLSLAEGLVQKGASVTLFTPGSMNTTVRNVTADLSYFEEELRVRGDSYLDLLKKHPLTFISMARQVQSELIAKAFAMANGGELDVVHIYTNEEDIALPFAQFCKRPVVFTHHDPFNLLVKYKNNLPKYKRLNWISLSYAQRRGMPEDANWAANIYHGLDGNIFKPVHNPQSDYIAYLGRIIEPKGVHLAIEAMRSYNANAEQKLPLKIAGKHYAGNGKDSYWQTRIMRELDTDGIEYAGYIKEAEAKRQFIANAKALIIPSTFEEPFGMVMIEALACGTPLIGLDAGAIPEIINDKNGILVAPAKTIVTSSGKKKEGIDEAETAAALAAAIGRVGAIDRKACRQDFEDRFSLERMCAEYLEAYRRIVSSATKRPNLP